MNQGFQLKLPFIFSKYLEVSATTYFALPPEVTPYMQIENSSFVPLFILLSAFFDYVAANIIHHSYLIQSAAVQPTCIYSGNTSKTTRLTVSCDGVRTRLRGRGFPRPKIRNKFTGEKVFREKFTKTTTCF